MVRFPDTEHAIRYEAIDRVIVRGGLVYIKGRGRTIGTLPREVMLDEWIEFMTEVQPHRGADRLVDG